MLYRALTVFIAALLFPLAALAAPTNLYLSDDFSGKTSFYQGTLDKRQFRTVDGQYEIDTTAADTYGQSVLLGDLDTYRVQVQGQMTTAGDRNSGFGLTVNYRPHQGGSPDFLLFLTYNEGYYTLLRSRIADVLRYPPAARRRGIAGRVQLEVRVTASGEIDRAIVVASSSHPLLDAEALDAVRRLGRVPFPEGLRPRPLSMRLPVDFVLN